MSARPISTRCGRQLDEAGLGSANLDLIDDIIACPGLDYCSLANARSIPVAQKISERFAAGRDGRDRRTEAQDLGLHQRLRPPPCRPHRHPRRRQEGRRELPAAARRFEAPKTRRSAKITGPGFDEDGIVDAVEKATDVYLAQRAGWRTLPRHLPPDRHGAVQGGDLWLRRCVCVTTKPPTNRPVTRRRLPRPVQRQPPSGSSRATMRARCCPSSTGCAWSRSTSRSFRDGRGYSSARILREAGYTGELRAVGDVLVDQIFLMRRCGFDSFAPDKPFDADDAEAALYALARCLSARRRRRRADLGNCVMA